MLISAVTKMKLLPYRHFHGKFCLICLSGVKKSKDIPRQTEVAQGGSGKVKAPDLLDFRHYKGGRSSAVRTGHLYPRRNPWYSFSEAESTSGHMVLSEGATEKIPSDTIGERSRDRPTSSAAPNHCATPGPVLGVYVT